MKTKINHPGAATLEKNCELLAEKILDVIQLATPHEWVTWDSFAGRHINHREPLRAAQRRMVSRLLMDILQ